MMKNNLAIIWMSLISIITAGIWLLLPPNEYNWIKYSLLALSVASVLVMLLLWLYFRGQESLQNKKLTKQDALIIQNIFKLAVRKIRGRGHNKLDSLYDLPWYLLLGGKGAAKSTLLQQNGLEPLLTYGVDESNTDSYLRFWSSDHAVVIEVGERIFNDHGIDEELGEILSQLLLKYRPRQSLNGVIAVISCDQLLKSDSKELQKLASIYQEAMLLINGTLQLHLPIYMVLSMVDVVADFVSFFESYSDAEIANPFGLAFPAECKHYFDKKMFETQTHKLLVSLAEQQNKLFNNIDSAKAGSIIGLPYQLRIIFERIGDLLSDIGKENRVRKTVWVRGVYLCSSGQRGLQHDLLTRVLAERASFNSCSVNEMPIGRRGYFTSRLLSHAFLPDKDVVGVNKLRQTRYLIIWSTTLLALLSLVVFSGLKLKNNWDKDEAWRMDTITQLRFYATNIQSLKQKYSMEDMIRVLARLRSTSTQGMEPKAWYQRVSTQQRDNSQLIYRAYEEQLNIILLPRLEKLIGNELKTHSPAVDVNITFEALRYYQMLFDRRKLNVSEMQYYLQGLVKDLKLVSDEDLDDFSLLVADLFNSNYDRRLNPDANLVKVATHNVATLSVDKFIYSQIKNLPQNKSITDIRYQLGDNFDKFFEFNKNFNGYLIPQMYTKQGFNQIDLTAKSTLLRQLLNEFKVTHGDMSDAKITELSELSQQIKKLYFSDYINYWSDLINNIHVRHFSSQKDLSQALKSFLDPISSPIADVLNVIVKNTKLSVEDQSDIGGRKSIVNQTDALKIAKGLRETKDVELALRDSILKSQNPSVVDSAFLSFTKYISPTEGQNSKAPITGLIQQFDSLNSFFDAALLNDNPGKIFHDYALAHAQGDRDPIIEFGLVGGQAPEIVASWIKDVSSQVWFQVINGCVNYLNAQWNEQVYSYYVASIKGSFPFVRQGRGEVSLNDFTEFFRPQGRIDKFFNESLKPFVTWSNGAVSLNRIDGMTLPISQETLTQFGNAHRLSRMFFGTSGQEPTLKIALKADFMNTAVTEFQIRENDTVFSYRHGPRFWTEIYWPRNNIGNSLSTHFYQGDNQVAARHYNGQWALFRMLFDGEISPGSTRLIRNLNYSIGNDNVVLNYTLRDSQQLLDQNLFLLLSLPQTL